MIKRVIMSLVILAFCGNAFALDYRSREIKYRYQVQKEDAKYNRDTRVLNLVPSGYMTVEEYEKQSEYKDKAKLDYEIPKIEKTSEFKYIPQPLYKIVKYNEPAGSPELSLGKKLYALRQINAQGIVSPDYSKLVYPAVYYYSESASTDCDLFLIPLDSDEPPLTKILKANIAKRNADPIMSTEKSLSDKASFRTLTPVDFSQDGTKLLVKEKLGSSEDGIWATNIYVYDFANSRTINLNVLRDAIVYYWSEYKNLNLTEKRWDIKPLGFDASNPVNIVVQAYAYTGDVPVYLGAWTIDIYAMQSRLISLDRNYEISISSNGYKLAKDGVEAYITVQQEEKAQKRNDKFAQKERKKELKNETKKINEDLKYELKTLKADYKDEYKDNKKLQSFKGSTETADIVEAYDQYQQKQIPKDIKKVQNKINKQQKKIEKFDNKIQKVSDETRTLMGIQTTTEDEEDSNSTENESTDQ